MNGEQLRPARFCTTGPLHVNAVARAARARAIENQCVVIGVNRVGSDGNGTQYSGDSLLVNPEGEVLIDAKDQDGIFTQEIDLASVRAYRERFPAWRDQDQFSIDL